MGWMLGHYVMLRQLDDGRELVILAVFTTFACDTSAYFVGRAWGRHRMTPTMSPHKTWEGAAGGFAGAVAAAAALCYLLNLGDWSLPLSYLEAVGVGCLVGVAAQLGDLAGVAAQAPGRGEGFGESAARPRRRPRPNR